MGFSVMVVDLDIIFLKDPFLHLYRDAGPTRPPARLPYISPISALYLPYISPPRRRHRGVDGRLHGGLGLGTDQLGTRA